jgi:hypothetical protein
MPFEPKDLIAKNHAFQRKRFQQRLFKAVTESNWDVPSSNAAINTAIRPGGSSASGIPLSRKKFRRHPFFRVRPTAASNVTSGIRIGVRLLRRWGAFPTGILQNHLYRQIRFALEGSGI